MKINKAKLLVGTLAVVATAATVGSISGTVAWFQYNTRATIAYEGATAHCSESLQVRLYQPAFAGKKVNDDEDYDDAGEIAPYDAVASDWKQDLTYGMINTFLSNTNVRGSRGNKLTPVTSGALTADDGIPTNLYRNPIYQYADKTSWGTADKTDYVDLPLQFRVLDVNGVSATQTYLKKKIYLTDLTLAAKAAAKDMTSALRVVVGVNSGAAFQQVFSKTGAEVTVGGELDLNNDGVKDLTEGYEFSTGRTRVQYGDVKTAGTDANSNGNYDDDGDTPPVYKTAVSQAASGTGYLATANTDLKIADDADPLKIVGKPLLETTAVSDTTANIAAITDWAGITLRIYLEGWTTLDASVFGDSTNNATPETVWDAIKVVGGSDVGWYAGMRFTAEAHTEVH